MTSRVFKLSALFVATSAILSSHAFADDGKKDIEKIQVLGDKHSN